ncbi:hypothetical protein [Ruegeria sp.]|uniref:hypothetical protein n=1 Tax=Ruegeria sp. TaxID=1879320 RepID=UPI003B5C9992
MPDKIDYGAWQDTYLDAMHPQPGRHRVKSTVSRNRPKLYRAYSDEGIAAALIVAEISEARMSALNAQQLGILTVQLTLSGGIAFFCVQVLETSEMNPVQFFALLAFLLALGSVVLIASFRNSTAYYYYYKQSSEARYLARHHHRLAQIHIQADRAYKKKIGRLSWMLDVHSIQWVNWTSLALSAGMLSLIVAKYCEFF